MRNIGDRSLRTDPILKISAATAKALVCAAAATPSLHLAAVAAIVVEAVPRGSGTDSETRTKAELRDTGAVQKGRLYEHPFLTGHLIAEPNAFREGESIKPIRIPFLEKPADFERHKTGISMDSTGEPKSGTTWTARVVTKLALHLCGSETNTWCRMGGLSVVPNKPDPSYLWEMIRADTGQIYLHFNGTKKHQIPGFDVWNNCNPDGRQHVNSLETKYPCVENSPYDRHRSRRKLRACLPDTSARCLPYFPSQNSAVRRMAVVFRDPWDVIISQRKYKIEVQYRDAPDLDNFIWNLFETIVAWLHQRWVWHKTFYRDSSHVMFYEDLQESPASLVDLAAFMGLDCTLDQVREVWDMHKSSASHGRYYEYDLPLDTLVYMNDTMSALLPREMLARLGLGPKHMRPRDQRQYSSDSRDDAGTDPRAWSAVRR